MAEEFREKALKDIISKETVRNNTFNYEVFIVRKSFGVQIVISAMINGKHYEAKHNLPDNYAREFIQNKTKDKGYKNQDLLKELRIMEYEILMSILLKSMFDILKDEFAKLEKIILNYVECC